ncbi:MAG: MoaD/ThiS family protein [Nitrososphaerota archaeon]|nr:MoaD/ThiS family protein [Nitrososphaerota archaeon]MDG6940002.1 MoaD/ThiS family protein [Nitrososphaerota archaeon]
MPKVQVFVPSVLLGAPGKTISVEAKDVRELTGKLAREHGVSKLLDDKGNVPKFLNVYVNGRNTKLMQESEISLTEGDEVSIVPAVAGG